MDISDPPQDAYDENPNGQHNEKRRGTFTPKIVFVENFLQQTQIFRFVKL
jgi:hypothetical protein